MLADVLSLSLSSLSLSLQEMVVKLQLDLESSDRHVGHLRAEKQKEAVTKKALVAQHSREASVIRMQLVQVRYFESIIVVYYHLLLSSHTYYTLIIVCYSQLSIVFTT
jgi:hypothetical protein